MTAESKKTQVSALDSLARDALDRLAPSLVFAPRARSESKLHGEVVGHSIRIRKPYRLHVNGGDESVPRYHLYGEFADIGIQHHSEDLDNAGIAKLAAIYDRAGAAELARNLFHHVGAPGGGLTARLFREVRVHSEETEMAVLECRDKYCALHPEDAAMVRSDIESPRVPSLSDSTICNRHFGQLARFELFETEHIPNVTVPDQGGSAPKVRGDRQTGGTLHTDGWKANARVLNEGNLITINGVYEVRPHCDLQRTRKLKTFTVLEKVVSDSDGQACLKLSPKIITSGLPAPEGDGLLDRYRNVASETSTDNTVVADSAPLAVVGGADDGEKTYRQALFWKRDALQYVHIVRRLPVRVGTEPKGQAVDPETWLSISRFRAPDDGRETTRAHISFGAQCVWPDMGIRIWTAAI